MNFERLSRSQRVLVCAFMGCIFTFVLTLATSVYVTCFVYALFIGGLTVAVLVCGLEDAFEVLRSCIRKLYTYLYKLVQFVFRMSFISSLTGIATVCGLIWLYFLGIAWWAQEGWQRMTLGAQGYLLLITIFCVIIWLVLVRIVKSDEIDLWWIGRLIRNRFCYYWNEFPVEDMTPLTLALSLPLLCCLCVWHMLLVLLVGCFSSAGWSPMNISKLYIGLLSLGTLPVYSAIILGFVLDIVCSVLLLISKQNIKSFIFCALMFVFALSNVLTYFLGIQVLMAVTYTCVAAIIWGSISFSTKRYLFQIVEDAREKEGLLLQSRLPSVFRNYGSAVICYRDKD